MLITLYEINCHVRLFEESLLICVISDKNSVVQPNIPSPIYILPYFWSFWLYSFHRVILGQCNIMVPTFLDTIFLTFPSNFSVIFLFLVFFSFSINEFKKSKNLFKNTFQLKIREKNKNWLKFSHLNTFSVFSFIFPSFWAQFPHFSSLFKNFLRLFPE